MGENKDKIIELQKTAKKLTEDIQNMANYKNLYNEIQRLVASSAVKKDDFKKTLFEALKNEGLETQLRNTIFHWTRSQKLIGSQQNGKEYQSDFGFLKKVQVGWEKRIQKSLNSLCHDLNFPLARIRISSERESMTEKWNELSTFDFKLKPKPDDPRDKENQYKPLYAPRDFLDTLFGIKDPSFKKQPYGLNWEFSHIPIRVKTLAQLREKYKELSEGVPLLGVNGNMPSSGNYPNLEAERIHLGEKVLASNHAPVAQEFLKRGAPRALRGKLWSLVLGSEVRENDVQYYEELKNMVVQYDLLIDKLIANDVQLTATNDDQYFVFEDVLYKTMLSFSRDSEVLGPITTEKSAYSQVIHAVLQGKPATLENTLVYPPSGVIPYHGFTMYATPFCYLYDNSCALYYTFRAFFLRHWFRLSTISVHEQGILALCILFERLLQCHEPQLWAHFRNNRVQPVRIVFKWLMRGFSGHLPPEQLLYLWDLILGYDSLEIVPLLAVAILSFRKENLMLVDTLEKIDNVIADLTSLNVMALLQLSLLKD